MECHISSAAIPPAKTMMDMMEGMSVELGEMGEDPSHGPYQKYISTM